MEKLIITAVAADLAQRPTRKATTTFARRRRTSPARAQQYVDAAEGGRRHRAHPRQGRTLEEP